MVPRARFGVSVGFASSRGRGGSFDPKMVSRTRSRTSPDGCFGSDFGHGFGSGSGGRWASAGFGGGSGAFFGFSRCCGASEALGGGSPLRWGDGVGCARELA